MKPTYKIFAMPRTLLKVFGGWFESEFSVHHWSEVSAKVRTKLNNNYIVESCVSIIFDFNTHPPVEKDEKSNQNCLFSRFNSSYNFFESY